MSVIQNTVDFVDRFQTTVSSNYTAGGTSLVITSGTGLPSGTCYYYLIVRAEGANTEEVFLVTSRSGTTLTVVGAQAGTSASNHASTAVVVASIETADTYSRMLLNASGQLLNSFYDPTVQTFAWHNQGSSTITTVGNSLVLFVPSQSSTNVRIREKAVPTAPYTLTVAMIPLFLAADFISCGLCLRDSGTGKIVSLAVAWDSGVNGFNAVQTSKFTNDTTFSAHYANIPIATYGPVVWLRIVDNNTNRITYYSNDGVSWLQLWSVARTDFLTPDKIGFYMNQINTSDAYIRILSWLEA